MANPTGTTNLTPQPGYIWTDNDVYQIPQTDQQEGAAIGASFGGLGVDNQPHQSLLDKAHLVHNNQLTDEANIAALQAFKGAFSGQIGPNGYVRIGAQDVSRGAIAYLIQWGQVLQAGVSGDKTYTVNWNIPFPNACYWASATMRYTAGAKGAVATPDLGVGLTSVLGLNSGNFFINLFNANGAVDGFSWMAIGF